MTSSRLSSALADRYRIERELGAGGMATELAAESRGSANVAEATFDPQSGGLSEGSPSRLDADVTLVTSAEPPLQRRANR